MSQEKIRITSLDFDTIKADFRTYLAGKPEFNSYDFEGSNINVLLDILAYNTHYQAVSANFIANEMFMDTAVKRSSIISHAKMLGYSPYSANSAKAIVDITVSYPVGQVVPSSYIIPKGTKFSTTLENQAFTFSTLESLTATKEANGTFVFRDVVLAQGSWSRNTLTFSHSFPFVSIPNSGVDLSTLTVLAEVSTDNQSILRPFSKAQTFLNIDENSQVYFVQEGFDQLYQIYFGDGVMGYKPINGSDVVIEYMTTAGSAANNASVFNISSGLPGIFGVTTKTKSVGGRERESAASIKYNALNYFGSQDRAVVPDDYRSLIATNINNVKSILAWGGEDQTPPEYGKIFFCIIPEYGEALTDDEKAEIVRFIKPKAVGNARFGFIDPQYVDISLNVNVKYSRNDLDMQPADLEVVVRNAIVTYADTFLNQFSGIFRFSEMIKAVDRSNAAIRGVTASSLLIKEYEPELYVSRGITFTVGQQLSTAFFSPTLKSSIFSQPDSTLQLFFEDDRAGNIDLKYNAGGTVLVKERAVGRVNYTTGEVTIQQMILSDYEGDYLRFYMTQVEQDIFSTRESISRLQNKYLTINLISEQ